MTFRRQITFAQPRRSRSPCSLAVDRPPHFPRCKVRWTRSSATAPTAYASWRAARCPARAARSSPSSKARTPTRCSAGGALHRAVPPRIKVLAAEAYHQFRSRTGQVVRPPDETVALPVDARVNQLARQRPASLPCATRVNGIHLRILAEHVAPGRAVQVAQPLTEVDTLLRHLRLILSLVVSLGGIGLAAALGRFVAGAAVAPVRLHQATEHRRRARRT